MFSKRSLFAAAVSLFIAIGLFTLASQTGSAQQADSIGRWGGRSPEPPCPVVSPAYRPGAPSTEDLSRPAVEPWCEPAEAVVGYATVVGPSRYNHSDEPPCNDPVKEEYLKAAAEGVTAAAALAAASASGPIGVALYEVAGQVISNAVAKGAPGDFGRIINGVTGNSSTCKIMSVAVPQGKQITRIQMTLGTPSDAPPSSARCGLFRITSTPPPSRSGCVADNGQNSAAAWFAIDNIRVGNGVVTIVAKNWSDNLVRVPYLRAYYRP